MLMIATAGLSNGYAEQRERSSANHNGVETQRTGRGIEEVLCPLINNIARASELVRSFRQVARGRDERKRVVLLAEVVGVLVEIGLKERVVDT